MYLADNDSNLDLCKLCRSFFAVILCGRWGTCSTKTQSGQCHTTISDNGSPPSHSAISVL